MISELYPMPSQFLCRELYRALFGPNPDKVQEQIAHAEWAIVLRSRQLSGEQVGHMEEEQDLNDALYALQALKRCIFLASDAFTAA